MWFFKKLRIKNKMKKMIFDAIESHDSKIELQEKERIQYLAKKVKKITGYAPKIIGNKVFICDLEVSNDYGNNFSIYTSVKINDKNEHTICSREDLGALFKEIYFKKDNWSKL